MIHEIEVFIRRWRRRLSRSEWLVRLLGLSQSQGTASEPGLVLVQIDGLSRLELEKAMAQGRLPFLQDILQNQRYHLHSMYSGVPSTTPAVTAELLYGVKAAVPAFSFLDRSTGRVFRMFDPQAAKEIERRLESEGKPLLTGGSAYAGIYTGGAEESHFCAASLRLSDLFGAKHPFSLLLLFILNAYSLLRTLTLLAIEFVLAFIDCARGLFAGRNLWKEIKFIPSRVATCILMRELAVIGTKIDVARGLPVVFLDLIGYDEQSHRRGPASPFAHWSLKGIDDAVKRIWKAARRSTRRDYDVWILSGHGNEDVRSYERENGRSVSDAAAEVFDWTLETSARGRDNRGVQSERGRAYLRLRSRQAAVEQRQAKQAETSSQPVVAAMGPVGHIYLTEETPLADRDRVARELVDEAKIPMVLVADGPGRARVWTTDGQYVLPRDVRSILPDDHPFVEAVAQDLVGLCHHPNAGDYVIFGWTRVGRPYSFPVENGAHAGPGAHETHAFALIPSDITLPSIHENIVRPLSLHRAALHHLGRAASCSAGVIGRARAERTLRVMTYNVHSCIGLDGKLSPRRIARVIARYDPDVVALQEVDVGRWRTEGADQAETIAAYLNMEYHFHPAMRVAEELYGDCVLSRLPMELVKAGALPSMPGRPGLEPRGALWVTLECGGSKLQLLNTHLGLKAPEKLAQVRDLLSRDWIGASSADDPTIFCGDFNALPYSVVWRLCRERFRDVQCDGNAPMARATWFGRYPMVRIDHIFVNSSIDIAHVKVGDDHLSRIASDHRPLLADLRL